jgi:hypothetical protein
MMERIKRIDSTAPTLEQRIANALNNTNVSSEALVALLAECEHAIAAADRAVAKAKEDAFDPCIYPDAKAARELIDDTTFQANRLRTIQPRLERRLRDVCEREQADAWIERYNRLKPVRDQLAEEFAEAYAAAPQIADVLTRISELNGEIQRLHLDRPNNVNLYLHSAEAVARGGLDFDGTASVSQRLSLPNFEHPEQLLWPRPQPAVDVSHFVSSEEYGGRYSSRWHEKVAQEQKKRDVEQARLDAVEADKRAYDWRPRQ